MVQKHIPLIIHKIVCISGFRVQDIRQILKVETFTQQFCLGRFGFTVHIQLRKNAVVFAQLVVGVPHVIRAVFVDFVVVGIATTIAAELFVLATYNFIATF